MNALTAYKKYINILNTEKLPHIFILYNFPFSLLVVTSLSFRPKNWLSNRVPSIIATNILSINHMLLKIYAV